MGILNREQAAVAASRPQRNNPGMCQKWVRNIFGAPSAGDRDRDGDADAVDGWKSEPSSKRHTDRNPPRGVPVAWSGGRGGYGHRAISLGDGRIASTDAPNRGHVGIVPLDWPEKHWGLKYLGWSETITGIEIPKSEPSKLKSITAVAKEVIDGKWGVGHGRETRLRRAGYNYRSVQDKVNELLKPKSRKKSVATLAKEVIDGKWGNGSDRKSRLTKAGYNYSAVQKKVNQLLK